MLERIFIFDFVPLNFSLNLVISEFTVSLFFSPLLNASDIRSSSAFLLFSINFVLFCSSRSSLIISVLFCLSSSSEYTSESKCLILSPLFIINDSIVFLLELFLFISLCSSNSSFFCCSINCTILSISALYSFISVFNELNFSVSSLYISSSEDFS